MLDAEYLTEVFTAPRESTSPFSTRLRERTEALGGTFMRASELSITGFEQACWVSCLLHGARTQTVRGQYVGPPQQRNRWWLPSLVNNTAPYQRVARNRNSHTPGWNLTEGKTAREILNGELQNLDIPDPEASTLKAGIPELGNFLVVLLPETPRVSLGTEVVNIGYYRRGDQWDQCYSGLALSMCNCMSLGRTVTAQSVRAYASRLLCRTPGGRRLNYRSREPRLSREAIASITRGSHTPSFATTTVDDVLYSIGNVLYINMAPLTTRQRANLGSGGSYGADHGATFLGGLAATLESEFQRMANPPDTRPKLDKDQWPSLFTVAPGATDTKFDTPTILRIYQKKGLLAKAGLQAKKKAYEKQIADIRETMDTELTLLKFFNLPAKSRNIFAGLEESKSRNLISEARFDGKFIYAKLATIRLHLAKDFRDPVAEKTLKAGFYEYPECWIITDKDDGQQVWIVGAKGGCYQHPHVIAGNGDGFPCFGEVAADKNTHKRFATVSWSANIPQYYSFWRGFLLSYYQTNYCHPANYCKYTKTNPDLAKSEPSKKES